MWEKVPYNLPIFIWVLFLRTVYRQSYRCILAVQFICASCPLTRFIRLFHFISLLNFISSAFPKNFIGRSLVDSNSTAWEEGNWINKFWLNFLRGKAKIQTFEVQVKICTLLFRIDIFAGSVILISVVVGWSRFCTRFEYERK